MTNPSFAQPPRFAVWLVNLFIPYEQKESIPGDLLEEFSDLALKSGRAFARRWYWRQSVKTTGHLISTGFRVAPWLIASTVLGGLLLLQFGYSLLEPALVAVLRTQGPYSNAHVDAYMIFLNNGILIGRVLVPLFVGCIVAAATKGREMVATMALGLVCVALSGVGLSLVWARGYWPESGFLLPFLVHTFVAPTAIVLGGGIVRDSRSAKSRRPSSM